MKCWFAWIFALVFAGFPSTSFGDSLIYWQDEGAQTIRSANSDGSNVHDVVAVGQRGTGLSVDFVGGKIYWTAVAIQRANLDGSSPETLVSDGLANPEGIEVDPLNGKIYWADQGLSTIKRANLDGSQIETVVNTVTVHPHDLGLDLPDSKIYWTDSLTNQIYRANLDGSGVEDIVNLGNTPAFPSPRGFALDPINRKMYWASQGLGVIQRSDLDGTNIENVFSLAGWNGPDGIALDIPNGKLYWTGLNENLKIQRSNLDGTNVEDLVTSGLVIPRGIDVGTVPEPSSIVLFVPAFLVFLLCCASPQIHRVAKARRW